MKRRMVGFVCLMCFLLNINAIAGELSDNMEYETVLYDGVSVAGSGKILFEYGEGEKAELGIGFELNVINDPFRMNSRLSLSLNGNEPDVKSIAIEKNSEGYTVYSGSDIVETTENLNHYWSYGESGYMGLGLYSILKDSVDVGTEGTDYIEFSEVPGELVLSFINGFIDSSSDELGVLFNRIVSDSILDVKYYVNLDSWTPDRCDIEIHENSTGLNNLTGNLSLGINYSDVNVNLPVVEPSGSLVVSGDISSRYGSDIYEVGTDIDAGEYLVVPDGSGECNVRVQSEMDDVGRRQTLVDEDVDKNYLISVLDGWFLDVSGGWFVPAKGIILDKGIASMLRVGVDVPLGSVYFVAKDSGSRSFWKLRSFKDGRVLDYGDFSGSGYAYLEEEGYLILENCYCS